jgi:hypothetical protein
LGVPCAGARPTDRRRGGAAAGKAEQVAEGDLAVLGYEFAVTYDEGRWHATAWKLADVDAEDGSAEFEECLSVSRATPLTAFSALYDALVLRPY